MNRALLALLVLGTACATPTSSKQSGFVHRAGFTTAIHEREPQNLVTRLLNDQRKIYFFTELRDMKGQTVTHRWKLDGKVMGEVPIRIGGPRWRVHSSKWLDPGWLGRWTASVVDSRGRTLASSSFAYAPIEAATRRSAAGRPAAIDENIIERGSRAARSLYDSMFGED